ncbi:MAG: hydrogenase nickel incorporation protein HypA [Candidatus Latescibacterota bacterium]
MHEFALAEGVIAAAMQAAAEGGVHRIATVRVAVGELQQIDPETFTGALRELVPATSEALIGAGFEVTLEPALLRCRACNAEFGLPAAGGTTLDEQASEAVHFVPELAHTWLRCPSCGSPDFEVIRGRGVWLTAVEGAG